MGALGVVCGQHRRAMGVRLRRGRGVTWRGLLAPTLALALLATLAGPSQGSGHDHHDHSGHDHGDDDEHGANCTASTLAPYECVYEDSGGDIRVHWAYLEAAGEVWLALETGNLGDAGWMGLSVQRDAGRMVPSEAVIAVVDDSAGQPDVGPYRITGYGVANVAPDGDRQSLTGAALNRAEGGRTLLRFNRTLDNGGDFPIDPDAVTSMGWAVDPGQGSLSYHSQRGSFSISFASGRAEVAKNAKQGRYLIHGYLNIAAWSFLVLSGILTFGIFKAGGDRLAELSAEAGRPLDKAAWALHAFRAHYAFIALGLVATATGVLYMLYVVGPSPSYDLSSRHGRVGYIHRVVGLAVLALPALNVAGAMLRPAKTHALYGVFRVAHISAGLLALCLAVTNVGLGVERYEHLVGSAAGGGGGGGGGGAGAFFEQTKGLAVAFAIGVMGAIVVSLRLTASGMRSAAKSAEAKGVGGDGTIQMGRLSGIDRLAVDYEGEIQTTKIKGSNRETLVIENPIIAVGRDIELAQALGTL